MPDDDATVFIVDDDPSILNSLRRLFESIGNRVRVFRSAEEFLGVFEDHEPGCLIVDMRLPGMSGLELQRHLLSRHVSIPIIFITGFSEVPTTVEAMKAGAVEFIEKPYSPQVLIDRAHSALALDRKIREQARYHANLVSRASSLTRREREVMDLVIQGKANKVIAAELGLSQKTVEAHRKRVMTKTRADSLAELVEIGLALRNGRP